MTSIAILHRDRSWGKDLSARLSDMGIRVLETCVCEELKDVVASLVIVEAGLLDQRSLGPHRRPPLILVAEDRDYEAAILALRLRVVDFWIEPVCAGEAIRRIEELLVQALPSPHYLARRIDRYLSQNYTSTAIDSAFVAKEFGISPGYVSRLMNMAPWKGFGKRLLHHRIRHAEDLLRGTDMPLYLVADECGFRSPARFSEAFSRVVGVPPKRFRSGARPISPSSIATNA